MPTNKEWLRLVSTVLNQGRLVVCRSHEIVEVLGCQSKISMTTPLVVLTDRELGYRFACAEAAWILSGDNRVSTIKPFSPMIESFSDDKVFYFGAYGPKIIDQLEYIGRALKKDLYSRQAVLTIWREKPNMGSNDIPCTISIQFIVREDQYGVPTLHLFDNMRSSDTWLGVPYDWFTFSMVGAFFCLYYRKITGESLSLGNLYFTAGSQHLYTKSFGYSLDKVKAVRDWVVDFDYAPLNWTEFKDEQALIDHLWDLARYKGRTTNYKWLKELKEYWRTH